MEFGFATVEGCLAAMHLIRDDARSAFSARLKHFQRLGFPPGVNTGRGRAAIYNVGHVWLLAVALELHQLGIPPERAVAIIQKSMREVAWGALAATKVLPVNSKKRTFFFLPPSYLASLSDPIASEIEEHLAASSLQEIIGELTESQPLYTRLAIFDAAELESTICKKLATRLDVASETVLMALSDWAVATIDRIDADDPQA